ncbi:hypothetical protein [Corallococcus silvisoli]|uniref:hypothetical protein n=1 Tax=Corallococcus silvisoli TaxID=2697031 RepID=UPI001377213C|nr:hypothetical protein [Corallococcus silvisoli]NBD13845.1 hypothetical protein [Corallococcus silvisoli]
MNLSRWSMTCLGVSLLLGAGCGGSRSNSKVDLSQMGPSINAKRYANLEKIAARDLKCAAELTPNYLGENQYQMRGCGSEGVYELRCRMGQCTWIPDVRFRAEFDLSCERTNLTVSKLDPVTVGVTGCGMRGTYRAIRAGHGFSWVLNSPVTQVMEAAPAVAPTDSATPTE